MQKRTLEKNEFVADLIRRGLTLQIGVYHLQGIFILIDERVNKYTYEMYNSLIMNAYGFSLDYFINLKNELTNN